MTDVTAPEDVGIEAKVRIEGRVVTSHKLIPRQCRRERSGKLYIGPRKWKVKKRR